MPNNITNIIKFTGSQDDIEKLLVIIQGVEEDDGEIMLIDFNKVVPMPDTVFTGNLGQEERTMYGSNNWYDWGISNWGTKWNAYSQKRSGNTIEFDTAWLSPTPIFDGLVALIENNKLDISFQVVFASEDRGNNTGYYDYMECDVDSGYYENESNEAYQAYMECNEGSLCMHQDDNGYWQCYDCDNCPNGDKC